PHLQLRQICLLSGQSAQHRCPCAQRGVEWFRTSKVGAAGYVDVRGFHPYPEDPDTSCPMHRRAPDGEVRFALPSAWRRWAVDEGLLLSDVSLAARETAWMTHPIEGDRYRLVGAPGAMKIELRADVPIEVNEDLWWWVDGERWARAKPPYRDVWALSRGSHRLGIGGKRPLHAVTIHVE
ncbi:MAG: hypothetical protein VYE40_05970, partial [Myxococcota bacterium]|nr:hypothetical protein [Myxococcota bacterium]